VTTNPASQCHKNDNELIEQNSKCKKTQIIGEKGNTATATSSYDSSYIHFGGDDKH